MKKILIIVTRQKIGGAQLFVLTLAKGLASRGHAVTVGYGKDSSNFLSKEFDREGLAHHRFEKLGRNFNPFKNIGFMFELRRYVRAHTPDIVHLNSSNAMVGALGLCMLSKKPKIIFTHHGLSFLDAHARGFLKKIVLWISFFLLSPYIDTSVYVGGKNLARMRRLGLLQSPQNIVILNGIDPILESKEEARKKIGEKIEGELGQVVVGSIGRLAYQKNYQMLIHAARTIVTKNPSVSFVLIGEGNEFARYQTLIKKLGIEKGVHLVGPIFHASRYINAFDIFVLTSLYEGLPLTLLEAMHAQLPVLVPRVGDIEEAITDDAQLFEAENQDEFETKLAALIENAHTRNTYAQHNKEQSKNFSAHAMIHAYEQLL